MELQSKDWLMFRVLLNKFHKSNQDNFLKNMPEAESRLVLEQKIAADNPAALLIQPIKQIEKVHFSWVLEAFKKIPPSLQPALLASLPEEMQKAIAKYFDLTVKEILITPAFKEFLINLLYSQFEKKEILPIEFLPDNPLMVLYSFSKSKLVSIIDYLGIYDLTDEIRQIVEKNLLNSIYEAIPSKKQQFLKLCLNQKEKLVTPRLDLANTWDKTPEKLEKILHKRGMLRLSHALSGQHPDFLWHIVHILDIGRGEIVALNYKSELSSAISHALTGQVLNVINFLKLKS